MKCHLTQLAVFGHLKFCVVCSKFLQNYATYIEFSARDLRLLTHSVPKIQSTVVVFDVTSAEYHLMLLRRT